MEMRKNGLLMTHFINKQPSTTHPALSDYFPVNNETTHANSADVQPFNNNITNYLLKEQVQTAEILWALKCVKSHYSYNSCTGIEKLFSAMFPDSDIARRFSCGEKKTAYICQFGLAPYFRSILAKRLDELRNFVLLFDETLNRSMQTKQMDIYVRYWHSELNEVCTRYYDTQFMGHGTAQDIFQHFVESTEKLNLTNVTQISMDGPAVNWAFYDLLQVDLRLKCDKRTLNIGTCGLHIFNNAFKNGCSETDWNIQGFLSALYWLFSDSPARRDDFLKVAKVGKFPLKFVKHRWLENVPATERALEIWFDIVAFVHNVKNKTIKIKKNLKSFQTVADAVADSLMPSKLNFFLSLSKLVQPFMAFYQSDAPLLPFFATDTLRFFKQCLSNFNILKEQCLNSLTSCTKLSKFNFDEKENHSPISSVSAGFLADKLVKNLQNSKKITEKDVISFRQNCREFVLKMLKDLVEKSPVNYALVRNITCLDPIRMLANSESCYLRMKRVMEELCEAKQVREDRCETVLLQFKEFVRSKTSEFKEFDQRKTRLDTFFSKHMAEKEYKDLWQTIKLLLILSHGQATVERGFSVNRKVEVENLSSNSYISLRSVYDHIRYCGSIEKVQITKEMRISVASARQKYMQHQEKQRLHKAATATKRSCEDGLASLSIKKAKLERDISSKQNTVKELSSKAESRRNLNLFIKCNNERKIIENLEDELKIVNAKISDKKCQLKNQ